MRCQEDLIGLRKRLIARSVGGRVGEAPKDAAEEAQDAAGVFSTGSETAQQEAQIVLVGGLHRTRRIFCGEHGLFNDGGEEFEAGGVG